MGAGPGPGDEAYTGTDSPPVAIGNADAVPAGGHQTTSNIPDWVSGDADCNPECQRILNAPAVDYPCDEKCRDIEDGVITRNEDGLWTRADGSDASVPLVQKEGPPVDLEAIAASADVPEGSNLNLATLNEASPDGLQPNNGSFCVNTCNRQDLSPNGHVSGFGCDNGQGPSCIDQGPPPASERVRNPVDPEDVLIGLAAGLTSSQAHDYADALANGGGTQAQCMLEARSQHFPEAKPAEPPGPPESPGGGPGIGAKLAGSATAIGTAGATVATEGENLLGEAGTVEGSAAVDVAAGASAEVGQLSGGVPAAANLVGEGTTVEGNALLNEVGQLLRDGVAEDGGAPIIWRKGQVTPAAVEPPRNSLKTARRRTS